LKGELTFEKSIETQKIQCQTDVHESGKEKKRKERKGKRWEPMFKSILARFVRIFLLD
jgi:hypothetical protein